MNSTNLPSVVSFGDQSISIIDRNGTPWLAAADLARALGYQRADAVARIYQRNSSVFTDSMSLTVNLTGRGQVAPTPTRIFSPRGAHLIAMFARTYLQRWKEEPKAGVL